MIVHVPLFNIFFPEDAMAVMAAIIQIAVFDIPYVEMKYVFGEESYRDADVIFMEDPAQLDYDYIHGNFSKDEVMDHLFEKLNDLDYESHYLSRNMGSLFLLSVLLILGLFLIIFLY